MATRRRVLKQAHTARNTGASWNDGARWGGPVTTGPASTARKPPRKAPRPTSLDVEAERFQATYGKPRKPSK